MMANIRRIQNEIKSISEQKDLHENLFQLNSIKDDVYHWEAIIHGPKDSLYDGYRFKLDIALSIDYPFVPPKVKFVTPIKHVNVNSYGDICIDILKNQWTPSMNISSTLISIILLLSEPNPDDYFDSELAQIYKESKKKYKKTIRDFCKKNKME